MNLLMFLSNRCNMTCDYCMLDLNRGKSLVLGLEQAKRALSYYFEQVPPRGQEHPQVTLLGGEPFLHYDLLEGIAEFLDREAPEGAILNAVTNGTLATRERLQRLEALGVEVTVSLDGARASNDLHRKLIGRDGRSAFDETIGRLRGCDLKGLEVNMVIRRDTVGSLLSNVEFLRQAGFRRLSFHPDVYEKWDEDGLQALERAMAGFSRYYRSLTAAAPGGLEITHLFSFVSGASNRDSDASDHLYKDLVLGADGLFYICGSVLTYPYADIQRWSVGGAVEGVDWKKRERLHRRARDFVHARLERDRHYTCPREVYFKWEHSRRDPTEALKVFHRADNIIGDALSALAEGMPGRAGGWSQGPRAFPQR